MGLYVAVNGATVHGWRVSLWSQKLIPVQEVSALVSISVRAWVPTTVLFSICIAFIFRRLTERILRRIPVTTGATYLIFAMSCSGRLRVDTRHIL